MLHNYKRHKILCAFVDDAAIIIIMIIIIAAPLPAHHKPKLAAVEAAVGGGGAGVRVLSHGSPSAVKPGEHILHVAVRVKCEQTRTSVAACLWLLNNLSTLVCEDILVHTLYNRLAAGPALSAEPLRPILSHFLC